MKIKRDINNKKNGEQNVVNKDEIESLNSKIVLFWGSQNGGKTSLATIIAKKLAEYNKHKNVLVVYTDENTPPIPYIFEPNKLENTESLGNIYLPINLTKSYILENVTTFKDIKNMGLLGFKMGEYPSMYPEIQGDVIDDFFEEIKETFDYVLIDGTTFFNTNQITFSAFQKVDTVVQIGTDDIKSIAYFKSQNNFLQALDIKSDKVILNKIKNYDNIAKYDYHIPYCEEIEDNLNKGNLLMKIKNKDFNSEIEKLIRGIF